MIEELKELKDIYESARTQIDKVKEPFEDLTTLLNFLKVVSADPTIIRDKMDKDYKRFFLEDFTQGMLKRLVKEKSKNENYLVVIGQLLEQFLLIFNQQLKESNYNFAFFDSVKQIFDYDTLLHNFHFQIPEEQLKKIRNTQQDWRKELKAGDMVDAIQDEFIKCPGWSQARINNIAGDTLHLEFVSDTKNTDRYLDRWSVDIAEFESKTKELFEWKKTLAPKSFIDGFDKNSWNKSHILDIKEQQIGQDRTIKMAYVAFRVYVAKSNRSDENGPYEGWSSRFDEWICLYSPRIQPFMTKSLKGGIEDVEIDEDLDYLFNAEAGSTVYAVPRLRKCTSTLYINLLNEFGKAGGFQNILDILQKSEEGENIDLNVIAILLECVSKAYLIYHKDFNREFAPKIVDLAKQKLKNIPEKTLREVKREKLEAIIKSVDLMQRRVTNRDERQMDIEKIKLDLCLIQLRSSFLDRRIQGLKDLNTLIKNNRYLNNKGHTNEQLIEWMHKNDVFSVLFDNKKTHLQIVQRCADILKLLLTENQLTLELTEQFWNLSKSDYKPEVYKIVNEGASMLKQEHINFIFKQIKELSADKLSIEEFQCLSEFGKHSEDENFKKEVGDFFWNVIINAEQYKEDIVNSCITKFANMVKNWTIQIKHDYLIRLTEAFNLDKPTLPCIKLFRSILKDEVDSNFIERIGDEMVGTYPPRNQDQQQQDKEEQIITSAEFTVKDSIQILLNEKNLSQVLLQNFQYYYNKLNQMITDEEVTLDRKKISIVDSKYTHHQEVDERLQLLKYLAEVSDFSISKHELGVIYDLLVSKSRVPSDYEEFLIWCKSSCEQSSSSVTILDLNQVGEFFTEKMQNKELDLKNLLNVGFEFLQHYFLSVNEKGQKLIKSQQKEKDKKNDNQEFNLASLYGLALGPLPPNFFFGGDKKKDNNADTQKKAPIFNLVRPPNELEQLDIVWNIALECQNAKVVPRAINFLIKIYSSLDQDLNLQKIQIQDQLIEKCIQLLSETSPADEFRTVRIIEIMKNIIYEAERKGTGGVQPHNAVLKGELLDQVVIRNKATNKKGNLQMQVYSNTTVWELRKIVAKQLDLAPKYLKLEKPNGTVIKDLENGQTLAQLGFLNDQQIYAYKNNVEEEVALAPLIGSDNKLTERAKEIFNEWFDMYSDENGQMTKETCQLFIRGCTGESPNTTDDRIMGIFKNYDTNNDGKIEREEFLTFYENSSRNKSETVRENMKAHNIRGDLKKLSDIVEESSYSKEDMPRYKISKNQQYFETLFSILDRHDQASQATWDLIQMLATNQVLYRRVLELQSAKSEGEHTTIDWSKFFDNQSVYKLLYTLQIVEAVMEYGGNNQRILVIKEDEQKKPTEQKESTSVGTYPPQSNQLLQQIGDIEEDNANENEQQQIPVFRKSTSIVEDDDVDKELREGWTKMFLKYNGFSYILDVFMKQNLPLKQGQLTREDKHDQEFKLKHFAFLLKLLRIFIITAYRSKERGTAISKDAQQFLELQAQLTGETGSNILKQINYQDFQDKILQTITQTLQNQEMIFEDKLIIENALNLWVAILSHHTDLIEHFYAFKGDETIQNSKDFIIYGLLYSNQEKVKEEFRLALRQLGSLIIQKEGAEQPLFFILRVLSNKFNEISQHRNKQYFNLFCELIDKFFNLHRNQNNQQAFEPEKLLVEIIDMIKVYNLLAQTQQSKQNQQAITNAHDLELTYIGLIQLASKIIDNFDISFSEKIVEQNNLIDEIFVKFLFASIFNDNSQNQQEVEEVKIKHKTSKSSSESKSVFGNKSKEAAYLLLNSLIRKSPLLMKSFFEKSLMPLMKVIRRIDGWNYSPPGICEKMQKYVGLKNLGCICYMNSMIQQFYMIPAFRYNLLCVDDHLPEELVEYKGFQVDDNVLHQFQKLIAHLELSQRQDYNPFEFCFAFKDLEGNPTNIGEQKDAQEFLNLIFDRVENQLRGSSRKYLLQSVFGGQTCSQMVCLECGKVKNRIEDFYNLSLPVKDIKSMEISLKKMIEGEVINDYTCDGCNKKVDLSKRTLISSTPNVLIVHLQRIIFNFDTFKNDKINTFWEFPYMLDLTPYSFYDVMKRENRLKTKKEGKEDKKEEEQQDEDNKYPEEETCFEYKLVGVNVHSGTAHAGHYWSYINTQRGFEEPDSNDPNWVRTENDEWLEFNDSQVKDFNFEKLKDDCFGGDKRSDNQGSGMNMGSGFSFGGFSFGGDNQGKSAYMLIYERKVKKPIKILLSDEDVEEEKQKNAQLDEQAQTEIHYDSKKEEHYKLIDYRNGAGDIKPNKIYKQVLEDNRKFEFENDIYSQEFFDFIKSNIVAATNLNNEDVNDKEKEEQVSQCKIESMRIGKKAILEIIAKCFHNKCITKMVELYIKLLQSDINVLPRLFMETCYEEDQYDYLIGLLLECTDVQARQAAATLMKFLISTLKLQEQLYLNDTKQVQITNEKGEVETEEIYVAQSSRFIMKCLSILNTRAAKNWLRLDCFLDVIQYFGLYQDSDPQVQKEKSEADIKLQEELGLSFLMKHNIIQKACDFVLGKKSPLCGQQEKRPELGGAYSTPNFSSLIKLVTRIITDEELLKRFPLNQLEKQMFLHHDLLKVMLGSSQGSKQFGKCLANMCRDNYRLSKKVAKVFIKSINNANYDQVKNYLTALKPFIKLQDSLKEQKLEWIFGFSQVMAKKGYREERYKYGIDSIGYINEEAALYTSPLATGPTDDALLAHLQKCKTTMDTFSLNCLKDMLHLMSKDDQIARYIYSSFAPTYANARFSDWFKSYIETKKVDAEKNSTYVYMKNKLETINTALQYLKIYEEKCQEFLKQDLEKLEQVRAEGGYSNLSEDWLVGQIPEVLRHCPPQILIGKQIEFEKEFLVNEENPNVKIVVQEIQNEYNYSNPQGLYNLSAPHLEIKTNTYATMNYEQYKKFSAQLERNMKKQMQKQQQEFQEQELQGGNKQDGQSDETPGQTTNNEANQQEQESQQQQPAAKEEEEEDLHIKVLPWEERSKVGSVLLRVLAIGLSKKKFSVKVSFKAQDGQDSNMKLPISYFKEEFINPETKCLGHLLKIDPSKPWGKIEMFVEVKEKDQVSQAPPLNIGLPMGSILISCLNCDKFNEHTNTKCIQCGTPFTFSSSNDEGTSVAIDTQGLAGDHMESYFDND